MSEVARIANEIRAEVRLTVSAYPEALSREYVEGMESALRQMEERSAAAASIVWDGTDEAFKAINDALPALDQFRRDDFGDGHAWIGRRSGIAYRIRGSVPLMCSVLVVGDSFVILPPEVTA